MTFIGIDQSYKHNAIVILNENFEINDFMMITKKDSEDVFYNAHYIADRICEVVQSKHPEVVVIEGLSFGGKGNQTRDLAGLQFVIVTQLRYSIWYFNLKIVAPQTLKKFATGSGRAEKIQMIEQLPNNIRTAFTEAGYKKTTGLSDLADAYWLAKYGLNNFNEINKE